MTASEALKAQFRERGIEALAKWTWDAFGDGPDPETYAEDKQVMVLLGGQVDAVLELIAADMEQVKGRSPVDTRSRWVLELLEVPSVVPE